jgi:hypothetical protein
MLSIDPRHPALDRCVFFGYPFGAITRTGWANLMGVGSDDGISPGGLDANTSWGAGYGAHPMLNTGAAAPSGTPAYYFYNWSRLWGSDRPKDFTCIARVRHNSTGQTAAVVSSRNGASNTGGFVLGQIDNGTIDGYCAIIYASGNQLFTTSDGLGAAATLNVPVVVAMVYRSAERRVEIWVNGRLGGSATNTGTDWTPYVASQPLCIGRSPDGLQFRGQIGPVGIFNRCLSAEEMHEWAEDGDWPWVDDDLMFDASIPSEATLTTTVIVDSILLPSTAGAVTFTTTIDAEYYIEGDIEAGPEPPAVGTFVTTVGAGSAAYYDSPEFGVFITLVDVASQITATAPVTFVTSVGVRSDARGLIDGRTDLIDTSHYRR